MLGSVVAQEFVFSEGGLWNSKSVKIPKLVTRFSWHSIQPWDAKPQKENIGKILELQRFCCGCGISQKGLNFFSVLLFNKYKVIGGGIPKPSSHWNLIMWKSYLIYVFDTVLEIFSSIYSASSWLSTLKSEWLRPK